MYALALALRDVADWIARIAQAAISLIFGSALLLAFVNIIILWITGGWLGRFMNPAVAVATFVWIFLTFVAFHIGTGLAVKAGLIIYRETRRFMMGFIIIESATGLFFYLVPIPIYLIFPLLIAISMWYFSSEMMDRKFDWNNFRKPAIWACGIILTVGLIISFGFFDRRDVQDPSRVAPYVKNEVSPYIKGQAKGAAEEIGKIFKKSPPADDKEIAQPPHTRPAPAAKREPYEITVALRQQEWSKPVYLPANARVEFFGPKAEFRREADGFLGNTYSSYPDDPRFQSGLRFRGPEGQQLEIKVAPVT